VRKTGELHVSKRVDSRESKLFLHGKSFLTQRRNEEAKFLKGACVFVAPLRRCVRKLL